MEDMHAETPQSPLSPSDEAPRESSPVLTAKSAQEKKKHVDFTVKWLQSSYFIGDTGSTRKSEVYKEYKAECMRTNTPYTTPAAFGKMVKKAFPTIKCMRKGPRGNAKHHYTHLQKMGSRLHGGGPQPIGAPVRYPQQPAGYLDGQAVPRDDVYGLYGRDGDPYGDPSASRRPREGHQGWPLPAGRQQPPQHPGPYPPLRQAPQPPPRGFYYPDDELPPTSYKEALKREVWRQQLNAAEFAAAAATATTTTTGSSRDKGYESASFERSSGLHEHLAAFDRGGRGGGRQYAPRVEDPTPATADGDKYREAMGGLASSFMSAAGLSSSEGDEFLGASPAASSSSSSSSPSPNHAHYQHGQHPRDRQRPAASLYSELMEGPPFGAREERYPERIGRGGGYALRGRQPTYDGAGLQDFGHDFGALYRQQHRTVGGAAAGRVGPNFFDAPSCSNNNNNNKYLVKERQIRFEEEELVAGNRALRRGGAPNSSAGSPTKRRRLSLVGGPNEWRRTKAEFEHAEAGEEEEEGGEQERAEENDEEEEEEGEGEEDDEEQQYDAGRRMHAGGRERASSLPHGAHPSQEQLRRYQARTAPPAMAAGMPVDQRAQQQWQTPASAAPQYERLVEYFRDNGEYDAYCGALVREIMCTNDLLLSRAKDMADEFWGSLPRLSYDQAMDPSLQQAPWAMQCMEKTLAFLKCLRRVLAENRQQQDEVDYCEKLKSVASYLPVYEAAATANVLPRDILLRRNCLWSQLSSILGKRGQVLFESILSPGAGGGGSPSSPTKAAHGPPAGAASVASTSEGSSTS